MTSSDLFKVLIIQRQIPRLQPMSYTATMKELEWMTLEQRRLIARLVMTHVSTHRCIMLHLTTQQSPTVSEAILLHFNEYEPE